MHNGWCQWMKLSQDFLPLSPIMKPSIGRAVLSVEVPDTLDGSLSGGSHAEDGMRRHNLNNARNRDNETILVMIPVLIFNVWEPVAVLPSIFSAKRW